MQESSDAKVSSVVDIVVRDGGLVYVCLVCERSYKRSNALLSHTETHHRFKVIGLPKIPTVETRSALDSYRLKMATDSSVTGKRKKVCTLNVPTHSSKKPKASTSLGAHDVVLARASSSSEAIADDLPTLPSLSNAVLDRYLERYSPVSPPGVLEGGLNIEGTASGDMGTEPLGGAAGETSEPDTQDPVVVPTEEPRENIPAEGSGVQHEPLPALMEVRQGGANRVTPLEIMSENVMAILLNMPPPWYATRVRDIIANEYPGISGEELLSVVRVCIRAAKATASEVRFRVFTSGGSWSYADNMRESRL